ncbi:OmpA family protein [Chitinophaga sp. Cy-1792]|uniref:OmpA family protein n=1 Tax=Chitinophaga sp. Cy-1792 TaxID=2608339 RepID=UPI001420F237|nr:OmpA family protein [Chitinophaga sp. Cy-1792]NIG53602.1 OmpA family protein [Chitinophaga sp. Cy-1792]
MIRNIAGVCVGLMIISTAAKAQEFGIGLSGGLQGLQYKAAGQNSKIQPGGILDIGYTFPLGKKINLISGITIGNYVTKISLGDGQTLSAYQIDDAGSAFRFDVTPTGYTEKQKFLAAGIPVLLQYHTLGKTQWYINAGAKLLFPFSVKYDASANQLVLSGYYPDYNVELHDLPQHGFGTVSNWKSNGGLTLKPAVTLSAATGFSFALSNLRLYTGLYMDYGLNDIHEKATDGALVAYSPTSITDVKGNSVLKLNSVDNARLVSFGLQVKLGIPSRRTIKIESSSGPGCTVVPPPAPVKDTIVMVKQPEAVHVVKEEQKMLPAPVKKEITPAEVAVINRPMAFGKLGQIEVPDGAKERLDSVANILSSYPDVNILIIGHTCDIGSQATNLKVGEARAKAAAAYLISKGVAASRIETKSEGEAHPLVPNTSEENRRKNRRVTIVLQ